MNFTFKSIGCLVTHTRTYLYLLAFIAAILLAGIILRETHLSPKHEHNDSIINTTAPDKKIRKEYLYSLLTNTTRSLIQMEIKARRLEENMRRIKERTADLLWKSKDKALWHILFKNLSRHIAIRHEFHQHSGLKRIMLDSQPDKRHGIGRRKVFLNDD